MISQCHRDKRKYQYSNFRGWEGLKIKQKFPLERPIILEEALQEAYMNSQNEGKFFNGI